MSAIHECENITRNNQQQQRGGTEQWNIIMLCISSVHNLANNRSSKSKVVLKSPVSSVPGARSQGRCRLSFCVCPHLATSNCGPGDV